MALSFKRITSSGNFIPAVDGLRFIALASTLVVHIGDFLVVKDGHTYKDSIDYSFLKNLVTHGRLGVPLFFVISGFILGMPFAKFHIKKELPVNIRKYFLRRITRLEPPYIVCMTILLFAIVFIAKKLSFGEALHSYLSSIIYSHNFIYPKGIRPLLNVSAWSLEIEVQFYILAPLIAYLFIIKSASLRRMVLCGITLVCILLNYTISLPFISLVNFIEYFLVGFLLADLYVSKHLFLPKTKFDPLIGLLFFILIWSFDTNDFAAKSQQFLWEAIQLASIFFLFYYVLLHGVFKLLSNRFITNIGGMCYSIYLLHFPILSMFGNPLLKISFSKYSFINHTIYTVLLTSVILIISAVFFLLIERPCMDKNWYKRIIRSA